MSRTCAVLLFVVLALLGHAAAAGPPPSFVGAEACAACHQPETSAWRGSQHDQAMQVATSATVLGDFADETVASQRVLPKVLQDAGYAFKHSDVESALRAALAH